MKNNFVCVIHGGAGNLRPPAKSNTKDWDRYQAREEELHAVLSIAQKILSEGGLATEAVCAAVEALENYSGFNAGKGAVLNAEGVAELDASIMDGRTGAAGGVAGLTTIKNPIRAAEAVMVHSPHTLLAGKGAQSFAKTHDLKTVPNSYFITGEAKASLKRAKQRKDVDPLNSTGTVGAVALDRHGNLAAATSTGGMTNKAPGRVSDTAVVGAGTYAKNGLVAVSCTGNGDMFLRCASAHDVAARLQHGKVSLAAAARAALKSVARMGSDGGIIAIDRKGNYVMDFNAPGMYRGVITQANAPRVGIFS